MVSSAPLPLKTLREAVGKLDFGVVHGRNLGGKTAEPSIVSSEATGLQQVVRFHRSKMLYRYE